MKQPVVRLKIRVRLPDGARPYLDPVPSAKGRLKPLFAFVDGNAEYHPEGVYFLRYAREGKRMWKHAGRDWQFARYAKLKQERAMAAQAIGVEVVHQTGKRPLRLPARAKGDLLELNALTRCENQRSKCSKNSGLSGNSQGNTIALKVESNL